MKITLDIHPNMDPLHVSGLLGLLATVAGPVLTQALGNLGSVTVEPSPAQVFTPPPPPAGDAEEEGGDAAPAGTLDKDGLPWDARIHATTAQGGGVITAKGVWRAKKGLDAAVKAQVEAELRAAQSSPQPVAAPPAAPAAAPPPPSAPVAPAPPVAPPPSEAPPPAAPAAPAPVELPPAGESNPGAFAATMAKITQAQAAGTVTQDQVTAALTGLGLQALRDLLNRADLIPAFEALAGV